MRVKILRSKARINPLSHISKKLRGSEVEGRDVEVVNSPNIGTRVYEVLIKRVLHCAKAVLRFDIKS
jgi:hypothetical protein